jgi:hypothetical protein
LNEKEGQHIGDVLELEVGNDDDLSREQNMMNLASGIREKLGIAVCVVHPTQFRRRCEYSDHAVAAGRSPQPENLHRRREITSTQAFAPAICWAAT